MNIYICDRRQIEEGPLPGPSAVISMSNPDMPPARIRDHFAVVARLNLAFHDVDEPMPGMPGIVAPTKEDAALILNFARQYANAACLIAQCDAGAGRSQAVAAALGTLWQQDIQTILRQGTYNRRLFRLLLESAGATVAEDSLVSLVVRIKYPIDRLHALVLSIQRQRHRNWEIIAVTDGPNAAAVKMIRDLQNPRIRLIETDKPLGRWGHPYRQLGLDACRGDFIGCSNDDNYYVPGYFDQMVTALELDGAGVAICDMLHSYHGWSIAKCEPVRYKVDLGCWIARSAVVRQVRWQGAEFSSDGEYVERLVKAANGAVTLVRRPLFIHN
jgi:predicted protein tyrosine phosphatase